MPERATVITSIFPGDRDRGVRLQAKYEMLRLSVALVNGASFGQKDPSNAFGVVQNGYDPNGFKTVVGRLGVDLGGLVGGLSGMWGRTVDTTFGKLDVVDTSKTAVRPALAGRGLAEDPFAAVFAEFVELAVKGEVIWASKTNLEYAGTPSDSCLNRQSLGWMVTLVQNIGPYLGVAFRLDQFDPLLAGSVDSKCSEAAKPAAAIAARNTDRLTRLGSALLLHGSANVKFTLSYEHLWEQAAAVSNDIVTAQRLFLTKQHVGKIVLTV